MEVRDFLCDPSVKVPAEVPIFTPQQTTTLDLDIRILYRTFIESKMDVNLI